MSYYPPDKAVIQQVIAAQRSHDEKLLKKTVAAIGRIDNEDERDTYFKWLQKESAFALPSSVMREMVRLSATLGLPRSRDFTIIGKSGSRSNLAAFLAVFPNLANRGLVTTRESMENGEHLAPSHFIYEISSALESLNTSYSPKSATISTEEGRNQIAAIAESRILLDGFYTDEVETRRTAPLVIRYPDRVQEVVTLIRERGLESAESVLDQKMCSPAQAMSEGTL